jgi:CheY-like chemotaxis protein
MIGGKIWIESDSDNPISSGSGVNNGSTFHFTIPYYPKEEVRNTDLTDTIDNAIANLSKNLKILIIDDDRISEQLLSIAFNKISRNVLKAGTGLEAVNICRNNPDIDLVLMDIKMPDMDGYEATRLIRKFNKSVIIIAQTAYGLEGDREKAIEAGCNEYLAKPVRIAQLNNLIKKLFI